MRAIRVLAALGLILGSFTFATPVAAGDPCYHDFALPDRDEGDEPEIKMAPCAFSPVVVRVAPGTTVEWFNDETTHLLTGANQEWGFRDAEIGARESVAFRFDQPGTYPYACAIHRGMAGVIVVGDGATSEAVAGKPAVVTIKAPSAAGASSAPSAAPAAVAPAAEPSTAVAPAPVVPAPATEPASAERTGVAPIVVLGLVGLVAVVVGLAAARFAQVRRARPGTPISS